MTGLIDEVRLAMSLPGPAERRAIRLRAGVSQERVAREMRVQRVAVARWETGARSPRGELRLRYARLLRQLDEIVSSVQQDADAS
jgi:transcriptional regulator with XRE-family HTH domain